MENFGEVLELRKSFDCESLNWRELIEGQSRRLPLVLELRMVSKEPVTERPVFNEQSIPVKITRGFLRHQTNKKDPLSPFGTQNLFLLLKSRQIRLPNPENKNLNNHG